VVRTCAGRTVQQQVRHATSFDQALDCVCAHRKVNGNEQNARTRVDNVLMRYDIGELHWTILFYPWQTIGWNIFDDFACVIMKFLCEKRSVRAKMKYDYCY